jgi:hypothetical protein
MASRIEQLVYDKRTLIARLTLETNDSPLVPIKKKQAFDLTPCFSNDNINNLKDSKVY